MSAPKRIQLRRTKGWRLPTDARAVTRPHYFGNPYRIGAVYLVSEALLFPMPTARTWEGETGTAGLTAVRCADATTAVAWYRVWAPLALEPDKVALLRGMDLACWCPLDQPCHADVLLRIAAGEEV